MRTYTHYCLNPDCEGNNGFDVRWTEDDISGPSYPVRDSCPVCGRSMYNQRVDWDDVLVSIRDSLWSIDNELDMSNLTRKAEKELIGIIYKFLLEKRIAW